MRLLVANRGEIALRIFRACRDLGIRTVAVYSDADRVAPHVAAADYAVRLGPAPARESYLNIPAILAAAKKTRANLVHPGYGFLAENAAFAQACVDAGLTFVGPAPAAIEAMGSKTGARALMQKAGVPLVPGTAAGLDAAGIRGFGRKIGFPILLKASAGGGGKGMRRVESEAEVEAAYERTSSEAKLYFGNPAVYAEKLIEKPRHVEVQIVGDARGKRIAVGERECSIQRRHQKVVEECPSPAVAPDTRRKLFAAAVAAADAVEYTSCGTVEFLLDPDGSFYFLEVNTRLQVEHPVTEEVWGVDLAVEMIRIALGEPLSFSTETLTPRGHAIECRIYAEDPGRGFAPSPGRISAVRLPQGPGVRNDVAMASGSVVPIDYDPMLGKLIVHGSTRSQALSRLSRALAEYEITGVETTLPLFRRLARDPEFVRADFDVHWLDRRLEPGFLDPPPVSREEIVLAAATLAQAAAPAASVPVSRPAAESSRWADAARREGLRGPG
jgi:acetyl-CoA carboxylase biotin carboxylase subunit